MVVVEEAYEVNTFVRDLEVWCKLKWLEIWVTPSDRCVSGESDARALCIWWTAIICATAVEGSHVDSEFPRWGSVLLLLCDALCRSDPVVHICVLVAVVVVGDEVVSNLCAVVILCGSNVRRHCEW